MTAPGEVTQILIIEDTLGVAQALQRALGLYRDGVYQVEACESGEAALKRLHEKHFDLLISDLRLPGMDGLELLRRARMINPGMCTVLITAYGSPEIEERARDLADGYLAKPFRLQELIRLIERVLAESAAARRPDQASDVRLEVRLPDERESNVHPVVKPPDEWERSARSLVGVESEADKRKSTHLIVLACDLDGTLAEDGRVSPSTWEALRSAKMAGLILILVTGRTLDSFVAEVPCAELCEAIVAENGAVVYFPRRDAVILPFGHLDLDFLQRLEAMDVPLARGMAIAASQVPHDETILKALKESHSGAAVEYNRDAIMLLPPGTSKGSGLVVALQELGYSSHNVVACGDAENDRSLFGVAELTAAVSNALPALKAAADTVLPQPDGEGVQTLIRDLLAGRTPPRQLRPDRCLSLGYRMSGAPLYIDPFCLVENNVGIFGSSGSGKSWLAGLLAEELLKQKYQVCIIDPEGDYRSLGTSPHTLVLGGPEKALPSVSDVLNIGEGNNISLILDLSIYAIEKRIDYVADILRALRGLRARRGLPHCFLVDEIQSFCPADGGMLTDLFLEAMQWGGFSVVSFRLSQIAPALLAALDHWLVTRLNLPEELNTLNAHLARYEGGTTILDHVRMLPKGQAYLCSSPDKPSALPVKNVVKFRVGPRSIPHIRHLHKYLRAPLPEWKRFYFYDREGQYLGRTAASLWEFREALGVVSLGSLQKHLEQGDFEHWLHEALHDEELARRVHKVRDRNLMGEALRQALLEVVIDRYEELEALA